MEIDKQESNESHIEHTLLSKQHDNKTDEDELYLKSSPSSDVNEDEEATLETEKKKQMLGSPRDNVDAFDESSQVVMGMGLPETKKDNDVASGADLNFSSTDLNEKKTEEKNDDVKNVVESSTSNKGDSHVSLDDLGVTVEDLKSIPWEAFDPTLEIRSWANDPWLGGYVEYLFSPQNDSDST